MTVRGPDLGPSGGSLCRRVAWSRGFRELCADAVSDTRVGAGGDRLGGLGWTSASGRATAEGPGLGRGTRVAQQTGSEAVRAAFGANQWLVDELYEQFLADRNSVDPAWWDFFEDYRPRNDARGDADANGTRPHPPAASTARRAEPAQPASADRTRPRRRARPDGTCRGPARASPRPGRALRARDGRGRARVAVRARRRPGGAAHPARADAADHRSDRLGDPGDGRVRPPAGRPPGAPAATPSPSSSGSAARRPAWSPTWRPASRCPPRPRCARCRRSSWWTTGSSSTTTSPAPAAARSPSRT